MVYNFVKFDASESLVIQAFVLHTLIKVFQTADVARINMSWALSW